MCDMDISVSTKETGGALQARLRQSSKLPTHSVYAFGSNDEHQCMVAIDTDEDQVMASQDILLPMPATVLPAAIAIRSLAFGSSHTALLTIEGSVYTTGLNHNGQCGVPHPEVLTTPKRLESLAMSFTAVLVSAGGSYTAVVMSDGQTATFGANDTGQCGLGADAAIDIRKPKMLKNAKGGAADFSSVACGEQHTLFIDNAGQVSSCGLGRFGALGHGDTETRNVPTTIAAIAAVPIRKVAAGERHSVALTFGGGVIAWGHGQSDALGLQWTSSCLDQLIPRHLPTLRREVSMVAAGGSHTLALQADGTLLGWGRGTSGAAPNESRTPQQISLPEGSARVVSISAGRAHSLALLSDGSVLSWGAAQSGQLGLGDTVEQPRPVRVWPRREETMEVEGAPAVCARVVGAVAGGHSSALLLADPNAAADQLAHNAATTVSLPTIDKLIIQRLSDSRQWTELASLVKRVFRSPAACNASFADEGAGVLHALKLEEVYVGLLRTFERAPAVLSALRDAIPHLIDDLEAFLHSPSSREWQLPSPTSQRVTACAVSRQASASRASPALSRMESSFSREPGVDRPNGSFRYVLWPIAVLLHNPLFSHAAEASHLHRIARLIDIHLSSEQRQNLAHILSRQPTDIFAARVVRPVREALDRAFRLQRAGGGVPFEAVVQLTRLLGLARDANDVARHRAQTGGDGGSGVPLREFYAPFVSEHLDIQRDYLTWQQNGPCERGVDWNSGWSFCSEPWVLNPQAKARLLHIDAAMKMQQSQHNTVAAAIAMQGRGSAPTPQQEGVLLPLKRPRHAARPDPIVHGDHGRPPSVAADPSRLGRPPHPDPASPYLILRVRRDNLIEDTLDVLACQSLPSLFRPLRVIFEGEPAVDEGGVRKEFFQCLVEQLFDPKFSMFKWCDEPRVFWFSQSPFSDVEGDVEEAKAEFFLVGLVLGLAIYNGVILDLHLPPLLWQRTMNEPVGFEHLKQIDPDLWRGLNSLLTYDGDVEVDFGADFSLTTNAFGDAKTVELIPRGAETPVTTANRHQYVEAYTSYLLEKVCQQQFSAFQRGFLLLCDGPAFSLLAPHELEELVCGTPHLDFHALEANTKYAGGFHLEHPTVMLFWEVVHSMSIDDKRALLSFATGCDRAPVGGLGKLQFVLQCVGEDSMNLPTSHTCFNVLDIPAYTTRAKTRDRLTTAIHNATGFGLQ